jgi:formylmethanofuran dehydrogenase subunit C
MPLSFSLRQASPVPLEVEGITPDRLRDKSLAEIEQLEIFQGNCAVPLAEFFAVTGDAADQTHEWQGDLSGVHWLGAKMTAGKIVVQGPIGRHLGSEMRGGEIHALADAGDWVGGEMHGGLIHVRGRAGHLVGSAYRGSPKGMTKGTIIVEGDAGNEIGHSLRRGLIFIGGNIGDLAGMNMLAGTIFVGGEPGIRHGAAMKRGTLCFLGAAPPILPTFRKACRFRPTYLRLVERRLRFLGVRKCPALGEMEFDLYNGDFLEGGRGELLIRSVG